MTAWTNNSVIEATIPIYCNQTTYNYVKASFPYMMDKKASSGGGSVPSFQWHVLPEDEDWNLFGVSITPLPGEMSAPLSLRIGRLTNDS